MQRTLSGAARAMWCPGSCMVTTVWVHSFSCPPWGETCHVCGEKHSGSALPCRWVTVAGYISSPAPSATRSNQAGEKALWSWDGTQAFPLSSSSSPELYFRFQTWSCQVTNLPSPGTGVCSSCLSLPGSARRGLHSSLQQSKFRVPPASGCRASCWQVEPGTGGWPLRTLRAEGCGLGPARAGTCTPEGQAPRWSPLRTLHVHPKASPLEGQHWPGQAPGCVQSALQGRAPERSWGLGSIWPTPTCGRSNSD